jgi:hypothetical protein
MQPIDVLGGMLGGVAVLNFFITVDGVHCFARCLHALHLLDACMLSPLVPSFDHGNRCADELEAFILHSPKPVVIVTLVSS